MGIECLKSVDELEKSLVWRINEIGSIKR